MKGLKDNPKINAIVVLKGDIMDTEYAEKKKKLEEINKKRIQMMKKKSLILKKHDVDEEFDEAFELSTEEDIVKPKVESTLLSTLISTPGLYIIVSFLVFISLYIMLDNLESSSKPKKKLK